MDYNKKIRYTVKKMFNDTINEHIVCFMLEKKHEYACYKKQFYLLKNLLKYNDCEFCTDFHKFISELDLYNDLSDKCTSYCYKIMNICGFSSIFDVHATVNKKKTFGALRANIEWLGTWYHFHKLKVCYKQTKRGDEVPSNEWDGKQMMEYISSALRNEYGISINLNKTKKEFKINYKVISISLLLFNFKAYESLTI